MIELIQRINSTSIHITPLYRSNAATLTQGSLSTSYKHLFSFKK